MKAKDNAVLRWVNDLAGQGIFMTDARLNIYSWNRWLEIHSGHSAKETIGRNLLEVYPELAARRLDRFYHQALNGQVAILSQSFHRYLLPMPPSASGSSLSHMQQSARIGPLMEDGQSIGTITIIEDVSDRVVREAELQHQIQALEQAEAAQRSSQARLQHLLAASPAVIYTCKPADNYPATFVSDNVTSLLGYSPQDFIENPHFWAAHIHPEDAPHVFAELPRLFIQGHHLHEYRLLHFDGTYRWMRDEMNLVLNPDGSLQEIVGAWYDITQSKQTQAQLQEQAALLDISTDAILVRDLENQLLFWNKGAERLYGWKAEEVLGKNANQLLYKGISFQLQAARKSVSEGGSWQGELYEVSKDGKEIIVESRWTLVRDEREQPKSILTVNTDITEKKELEAQFLRTQRLESIGTLAGGIAHDLNNVLAPILMAVQLLEMKLPDEQSQKWLEILETNVKRAADLVKQVLSFARGVAGERTPLQVKHLILEIKHIAQETFPRSIEFSTAIPENLWNVSGDATQLHQVLLNLCLNARDAMPTGGILRIGAQNIYIDENSARINIDAKGGHYIVITVSDTGTGMTDEIVDKIFDPFFTTKEQGLGTGLGLSTVFGIIKTHGGFVNVFSKLGEGTQFKVYLPAVSVPVTQQPSDIAPHPGQGELILVVDDEAPLIQMTETTLKTYGYTVVTAVNGIEAVALYAQHKDDIGVVLLDMMMPEMDGLSTMRILKRINPQVKIIVVSGLAASERLAEVDSMNVKTFLTKPYTAKQLLQALHDTIRD